jgi:hypothetical protein
MFKRMVYISRKGPKIKQSKMITITPVFVGIFVQGASVRRVRVHSFWRVRNGKKEYVRAHWRYISAL